MSQRNVEIVEQGLDSYARGGWRALLPFLHPEFEFSTPPEIAMEPDTYRGAAGLQRYFESFEEAMDDIRILSAGDLLGAGDKVFLPLRLVARGKETGIEVEQRAFAVWTLRDGKVLTVEFFASREAALEATGLDPRHLTCLVGSLITLITK